MVTLMLKIHQALIVTLEAFQIIQKYNSVIDPSYNIWK